MVTSQTARQNPFLLWLILWFLVNPILYLRNAINLREGNIGGLLVATVLGVGMVFVGLVLWFIVNWIYGLVTGGKKLAVKEVFMVWLVFFAIIFFLPALKG